MEVKIGVQHVNRELTFDTNESADEVEKAVAAALQDEGKGLLQLTDDQGRKVLVPASRLAYVEIGEEASRRVGFGSI